jgi:hypothetical protein
MSIQYKKDNFAVNIQSNNVKFLIFSKLIYITRETTLSKDKALFSILYKPEF